MNRTPQILFDVYDNDKLVLHLAPMQKVTELTGVQRSTVSKAAASGSRIHDRYTVKLAWESGAGERCTEKDARKKFGDEIYNQWKRMNRRYGNRSGKLVR